MKKFICLLFLAPLFVFAQDKIINHTVAPKESYSSIGRLYNINGRELANYNNLDYEKGLSIGQVLKVPVKNAAAVGNIPAIAKKEEPVKQTVAKNGEPTYHTVAPKQTLYGVSKLYNITIADIKKWNNLTVDALNEGAKIIVGYNGNKPESEVVNIVKKETEITKAEKIPETKVEEIKAPEVVKLQMTKETKIVAIPVVTKNIGNGFEGGYFKNGYDEKTGWDAAKENGTAAVFKSTSGWEDGKYYCLHNSAAQNTIVKITNTANGKVIYAKVLDVIPDIKQNSGIVVRISNAAAAELGAGDNQFNCTINYSK